MPTHTDWRFAAPSHPLIQPIPAFNDNYFWLLQKPGTRLAAVVDPGDAEPVLARLAAEQLTLASILLTHHHADHTGGVAELCARTAAVVFGPADEGIAGVQVPLSNGDSIDIFQAPVDRGESSASVRDTGGAQAGLRAQVIAVPGHTRGHIAYWLSQVDQNLEVTLDLGSLDQDAFNISQLRMSYSLMNGRLRITRDGTLFSNQYTQSNVAALAGDWMVDYLLTPDGKFKVKMYSRSNFNMLLSSLNTQSSYTTGLSLSHTQSFNRFSDLLRAEHRRQLTRPVTDTDSDQQ